MNNAIKQFASRHALKDRGWAVEAKINPSIFSLIKNGKQEPTEKQKFGIVSALNRLTNSHYQVGDVFPTNGGTASVERNQSSPDGVC